MVETSSGSTACVRRSFRVVTRSLSPRKRGRARPPSWAREWIILESGNQFLEEGYALAPPNVHEIQGVPCGKPGA